MGLDYEQYAKELARIEIQNEPEIGYADNDIKDINEANEDQAQTTVEPTNIQNRRIARDAPKPKKEDKDEWGDDIQDDLNL